MQIVRQVLCVVLFGMAAGGVQAETFSAERGAALWTKEVNGQSCTTCHGETPKSVGRHSKTGKRIEPMAPSVNPKRLTDQAEMEKWFLRNCKSVFGRVCTAQEKGDILLWLGKQ